MLDFMSAYFSKTEIVPKAVMEACIPLAITLSMLIRMKFFGYTIGPNISSTGSNPFAGWCAIK